MKNKTVLVTGGAKGIGKAICETFAKNGYNILINYNTSFDDANALKSKLNELYKDIKVEIFKCDVKNRKEVNEMIKFTLNEFRNIDTLVNNAGVSLTKIFNDVTNEEFFNVINTNLTGVFNVTQEVLNSYMINKKDGKIINISSIWGITGSSMEAVYSASKSGIIGMSKALAKELGPSNIRVNVVCPGWIDTDMNKEYSEADKNAFISDIPLGRVGNAVEVAKLVYFLASEDASYITGQVINIDGGYLT